MSNLGKILCSGKLIPCRDILKDPQKVGKEMGLDQSEIEVLRNRAIKVKWQGIARDNAHAHAGAEIKRINAKWAKEAKERALKAWKWGVVAKIAGGPGEVILKNDKKKQGKSRQKALEAWKNNG